MFSIVSLFVVLSAFFIFSHFPWFLFVTFWFVFTFIKKKKISLLQRSNNLQSKQNYACVCAIEAILKQTSCGKNISNEPGFRKSPCVHMNAYADRIDSEDERGIGKACDCFSLYLQRGILNSRQISAGSYSVCDVPVPWFVDFRLTWHWNLWQW